MECDKILWKEIKHIISTWYRIWDDTISNWISDLKIYEDLRGKSYKRELKYRERKEQSLDGDKWKNNITTSDSNFEVYFRDIVAGENILRWKYFRISDVTILD